MAPVEDQHERTDEEEKGNKECLHSEGTDATAMMGRKLKRKLLKKEKRKQARREAARREREEEEARLNDPEEQLKLKMMEEEEAERMERDRLEFEERERRFLEALKQKMKLEEMEQEEEERRKLEESQRRQVENENSTVPDEGSDWEYVEEGPAEIIWQGNEITVRKKMVKVPKKKLEEQSSKKDIDRPISNPLAPQSEAFEDFKSAQEILDSVAQQVPNFGTEQDKAHCPFHLKTGACRFGTHCSRVHFYPDKSCTLLLKNMYNGSGLAWEQDEGLEYTEEEIERDFEDFYEDVHTEFLKFGEIVNFKVCKNGSSHLRGNVYVHYKYLESAVLAYHSINGRYFAGKQVTCEFVNVTKWKVAICGEFMKSKYKTCSRGSTCNFIHCFRNPGGDYEWADFDKSAPRHWVRKMGTLFGYKDDYDKQMGSVSPFRRTSAVAKTVSPDGRSHHSRRRSRSRDLDMRRRRNYYDDDYDRDTTRTHRSSLGSNRKVHSPARDTNEEKIKSKRVRHSGRKKAETGSDDDQSDGNRKSEEYHHTHKRSYRRRGRERRKISPDTDSETDMFVRYDHKTDGAKCNKSSDADRSKNLLHDDDLDSEPSSFGSDKIERRNREERYSRSKRKGQRWRDSEPKYSDNESTREDSRHRRIISELPSQHSYSERSSRDDKAGSLRTEGKKSDLIDYNSQEDRGSRPVSSRKRGRDGHGESKRHHVDKRASPRHSRDLLIHGSDKDSSKEETKVGNGGEDDSHFDGDQDGGRVSTRRRVKEGEPNSYSEVEHKNKVNHEEGSSSERGRNEENVENDEDDDDVLGYKENTVVNLGTEEEKAHRCAALKKLEEKKRAKEKLVHQDSGRVVSLRSNDDAGGSMLIENNVVVGEVPKYEKADIHSRKRLRI